MTYNDTHHVNFIYSIPFNELNPNIHGIIRGSDRRYQLKIISILIFIASIIMQSQSALACARPNPLLVQKTDLTRIIQSEEFNQELKEQMKANRHVKIEKIEFSNGFQATLSNGCVIEAKTIYQYPKHVGMCPMFKKVEVATTCFVVEE